MALLAPPRHAERRCSGSHRAKQWITMEEIDTGKGIGVDGLQCRSLGRGWQAHTRVGSGRRHAGWLTECRQCHSRIPLLSHAPGGDEACQKSASASPRAACITAAQGMRRQEGLRRTASWCATVPRPQPASLSRSTSPGRWWAASRKAQRWEGGQAPRGWCRPQPRCSRCARRPGGRRCCGAQKS